MALGGKRPGAGPKKDSIRPNFFKFVTPQDIQDYIDWVKKNYQKNDRLAQWYGDHLFGKAQQSIDLSNTDGSLKTIIVKKDGRHSNDSTAT